MRMSKIKNVSDEYVCVPLTNGAQMTLCPRSEVQNIDIAEKDSLVGKVEFVEDLTEVRQPEGKKRIFG